MAEKVVRHTTEALRNQVRTDGDIDAVVYRIQDTGTNEEVAGDRYRHTISHNLRRVPIGCHVIMADDFVNVKVLEKDENKIIVQFDTARADVNLRIW